MRMLTSALAVLILSLSACAGSQSDDSDGDSPSVPTVSSDVCGLVSDETVGDLQEAAGVESRVSERLMRGAELFVECRLVADVAVGFAVRAAPGGPTAESMVEGAFGSAPEPLPGVGDSAVIGTNSYDGVRIAAIVEGQELIVNSNAMESGSSGITREIIVDLATEVASAMSASPPTAIQLPEACPPPDEPEVVEAVGQAVVARGAEAEAGVSCEYASDERLLRIAGTAGDAGMNMMFLADSDPEDRVEVDGVQALFDDDDSVALFLDDSCVISASASPLGWALADQRPASQVRDATIAVATWAKESVGCPD